MGRIVGRLAVAVLLVALAGCTEPVELRAFVDPPTGHVPYAAHIVCSALPGTYTYELPDGTSVTTRDSELAFTVDRLEWSARIVVTVEDDWGEGPPQPSKYPWARSQTSVSTTSSKTTCSSSPERRARTSTAATAPRCAASRRRSASTS